MAKEETKAPEQPKKLTYDQLTVYAGQLENRLKAAAGQIQEVTNRLQEAEQALQFYQMQDYYQRAQLLCMIAANEKIGSAFREQCESELYSLVFPPQEEKKDTEEAK